MYDQLADRWVITQFAVSGANGTSVPYLECLAVSTSSDPAGTYYRYSFPISRFPDYPKLGVWPDAYYMSTNDFNGNTFAGATIWAVGRTRMLAGQLALKSCAWIDRQGRIKGDKDEADVLGRGPQDVAVHRGERGAEGGARARTVLVAS